MSARQAVCLDGAAAAAGRPALAGPNLGYLLGMATRDDTGAAPFPRFRLIVS
jgi:hypothetical protein